MQQVNRDADRLDEKLKAEYAARLAEQIVISGCVGPRGDGYVASATMALDSGRVHQPEIDTLAGAGADMIWAITMTTWRKRSASPARPRVPAVLPSCRLRSRPTAPAERGDC